jgi:hypothetical protein
MPVVANSIQTANRRSLRTCSMKVRSSVGRPDGSLGALAGRWVGRAGDVARDQSPAQRILQGAMQDVVDIAHGLLRHRAAVAAPFAEQRPVEAVEVGGGELLQFDPAERRDDVCGDVDAVVRHGAGPAALRGDGR